MPKIAQQVEEVLVQRSDNRARVSDYTVEVLRSSQTASPTTVTGAGVSQDVVEVLIARNSQTILSNYCVELLYSPVDSYSGTQQTPPPTTGWVSIH